MKTLCIALSLAGLFIAAEYSMASGISAPLPKPRPTSLVQEQAKLMRFLQGKMK